MALRVTYDAFGQPIFFADGGEVLAAPPVDMTLLWQGARWDADLGLYYMRYRWYDPEQGQFLTRDPLGLWGDPMNLGHGTLFAGHDPVNFRDPYGLQGLGSQCWGAILDYTAPLPKGKLGSHVLTHPDAHITDLVEANRRADQIETSQTVAVRSEQGAAVVGTGIRIVSGIDPIVSAGEAGDHFYKGEYREGLVSGVAALPLVGQARNLLRTESTAAETLAAASKAEGASAKAGSGVAGAESGASATATGTRCALVDPLWTKTGLR